MCKKLSCIFVNTKAQRHKVLIYPKILRCAFVPSCLRAFVFTKKII
jgi:hypothetical protein